MSDSKAKFWKSFFWFISILSNLISIFSKIKKAAKKIRDQNEPLWLPIIAWVVAWALSCCLTSQSKSWKSHWKFPHLICIECFWLQWFKISSFVSYWFPQSIQYLWSVKQCFFKSLIENRIRPQNLHLAWPSASFRCTVLIPREFFVLLSFLLRWSKKIRKI